MSDASKIEWTDATWNPVTGCTKVSPGCDHCYAETLYERFNGKGSFATVTLHPDRLDVPLRWRKPRRVFVNSMSDLFHDDVPDEFIVEVFARMWWSPQHTFQILTKRHGRMRSLLPKIEAPLRERERDLALVDCPTPLTWPLPNVWLGVSTEDQKWADIRIPALLDTPAAVRWISAEPLLGPIDLGAWTVPDASKTKPCIPGLDWVVVGGESGAFARPMHPVWARSLRDQCQLAGVPFLFKQWGEWGPVPRVKPDGRYDWKATKATVANDGTIYGPGDLAYPDGPRYGEAVRAEHNHAQLTAMYRVGKKHAGRELDDRAWDQYPAEVIA